jgi:cyclohexyl-isocyanide hydratase
VVDGAWVFAAGVTAGIDAALRLTAEPRRDEATQTIRLHLAYAPEPPFDSGTPETVPSPIPIRHADRCGPSRCSAPQTARRVSAKLGIAVPAAGRE